MSPHKIKSWLVIHFICSFCSRSKRTKKSWSRCALLSGFHSAYSVREFNRCFLPQFLHSPRLFTGPTRMEPDGVLFNAARAFCSITFQSLPNAAVLVYWLRASQKKDHKSIQLLLSNIMLINTRMHSPLAFPGRMFGKGGIQEDVLNIYLKTQLNPQFTNQGWCVRRALALV
jgi:hypothetical protein